VERREDISVEVATGEDPLILQTVWAGACVARPEGSLVFHSDPAPDQLQDLILGRLPPKPAPPTPAPLQVDPERAIAAVTGMVVEAGKRLPGAYFKAKWVEFDQRVKIAREQQLFDDRRETRRIRLEGHFQRSDRTARAAAERVVQDDHLSIDEVVSETIGRLETRLDAADPVTGPSCIVFAPAIGGVWIHELVGHAAEADRIPSNRSWLTPEIDSLPAGLTVIDDPRRARAAWRLDDEGTPARPVALVHEGRPRERLHSNHTASKTGSRPTGHGRRGSYREPVLPRMGCTFVANGPRDPVEILQNIKQGVYVRRMESAHTDPASGRAVFRVTDADLIAAGKIDRPLKPHLLETVASKALAAIDGIGNDLSFDRCIGTCHRDGQPLPISVGAPTICTRLMTVRF